MLKAQGYRGDSKTLIWPRRQTYFDHGTLNLRNLASVTSRDNSPVLNSLHRFGKLSSLTSMWTSTKSMPFRLEVPLMKKSCINLGTLNSLSTRLRPRIQSLPRDLGCQPMNTMQMQSNLPTHIELKNWNSIKDICSDFSKQLDLGNKGLSYALIRHSVPHLPIM